MATRHDFCQLLAPKITDELIVTSIGGVDDEWYATKDRDGNLYHITMSVATSVALGLALTLPRRRVISLDGDGSILMGLPVLTDIGHQNPSNLIVIVFDNESYEGPSRRGPGKLPTHTTGTTDLAAIARGAGIKNARLVKELPEFQEALDKAFQAKDASFISVKVEYGPKIPASKLDGPENKYRFIRYIEKTENIKLM